MEKCIKTSKECQSEKKKEIELKINYLPLNVMADVFGIEMKECYCYAQLVTPEASI